MTEKFPVHIMIKPEGLENFPGFIRSRIELLEAITGAVRTTHLTTRLTLKQAELIYPQEIFLQKIRDAVASGETEHYIFHGNSPDIYDQVALAKGKANVDWGIRGTLVKEIDRVGLKFERWQNFIHSSDTLEETRSICFHFNKDLPICSECAARELCYGKLKGSDMPATVPEP